MRNTSRVFVAAVITLSACERVDSVENASPPKIEVGPGVSLTREAPTLSFERIRREPPPPPEPTLTRRERMQRWFGMLSMEAQQGVKQVCRWNAQNPCGPMLRGTTDPRPEMLSMLDDEERPQAYTYCDVVHGRGECNTPLVVAFDRQPVAFANHLPTSATPWLALDRDGDGAITSRAELFGDATVLDGGTTAANGFIALAALDVNRDGVIDRRDPAFAELVLWTDRNGDRQSSPGELRRASEVLISIPLANHRDVRCTPDDDCEGERGVVQWRADDGSERTGALVDVYVH